MMCPNGRVGSTIACLAILVAAGCSPRLDVTIEVADEAGALLAGVAVDWPEGNTVTDEAGRASIRGLSRPIMTVLSKAGCLDEPLALGWDDAEGTVQVTMLSDLGGRRVVVHCGGDSMLGRRYEDPAGEAGDDLKAYLIQPGDGGSSARTLVEYMAPMFGSADLRTLNIETAVGRFPDTAAYPGKRWILRTDPDALAAMDELGVDAVLLGNNHLRDFLDAGIASTLDAAAAWELDTVGGGMTAEAAESPLVLERRNSRIGILAYTSVDGSYVNDSYPVDEDPLPENLDPSEAWQWEAREWGWTGGNATVPTAQRRIGSAWAAFEAAERTLGPDDDAALWTSVSTVYPELQDWVARRGHGGAALWETAKSTAAIAALRSGVDILIVDLHSGFQYAEVPSERLRQAAYDAIDAGADLVVGHHPHVLQGAEWYRGKLIVWSLGNFIFDQSFLVTFPSAFLRTVWEDGRLIQAQLIPMMLEDYQPVPVVDGAARNILRAVWDSGLSGAAAARGDDLAVRAILPDAAKEGVQPAAFQFKNHAIEIRTEFSEPEERSILFTSPDPVRLDVDGLVWSPLDIEPPWDVALGRSQFGWGGFENVDVDDESVEGSHWALEPSLDKGVVDNHAWRGRCSLRMHRKFTAAQELIARPVARIPLTQHRFWRDGQTAADGLPLFSIHAAVQAAGDCDRGMFRLDYYYFNDTDPTVAPESALIRSVEYPIEAPADWRWHEVWIDIPPEDLAPDEQGRPIVSVLLYVVMKPSCFFDTTMWFDDVDLVAWRNAVDQPPLWGAWDWVRCYRRSATEITVRTLPW